MRDLWKGDALRTPFLMLVLLLAPVGLTLMAGALASTITSDLDAALLGWGALAVGGALALYLGLRYAVRRSARAPREAQATSTTGAGDGESAGPSRWATSPSE